MHTRQERPINGASAVRAARSPRPAKRREAVEAHHLDLGHYLPFLINRVGEALVERFSKDALAAHGLSIGMWRVLAALSEHGVQRQIDVATATSIDASTLSRLVTRLVRMRLVTRRRSRTSNREVLVQLTPHGTLILDGLIPVAQALHDEAVRAISSKDQALLQRLLHRMYTNVMGSRSAGNGTPSAKPAASRSSAR